MYFYRAFSCSLLLLKRVTVEAATASKGYGPRTGRWDNFVFDGDEQRYEMWEVKMLAYMNLRKLKKTILASANPPDPEKNEEGFSELIQFLDERNLGLVMRDAVDDGKKALQILREHYAGTGKPRIISLYTQLTSLQKKIDETCTDYILRAENTATSLKKAGEVISDGLLIAMITKGLPSEYKSFVVVITQSETVMTFMKFKTSLRTFEENENAMSTLSTDNSSIMHVNNTISKPITCYSCGNQGHKAKRV